MLFAATAPQNDAYAMGVLVGALFAGIACGMWPLSTGAKKGRPGLGAVGFFACLGSGLLLGCLLALPVAFFFHLLITSLGRPNPPDDRFEDGFDDKPFNPYANGKRSAF